MTILKLATVLIRTITVRYRTVSPINNSWLDDYKLFLILAQNLT
jgi:hypothetical protein